MYKVIKRLLDIIISLLGIIILIPLFLILFIVVLFDSKGRVIFRQKRVGKNNKLFIIYKFRTMKIEAPSEVSSELFLDANKYISKTGQFLRKTHLDELPQLFNILLGQMTFVGYRPIIKSEIEYLNLRQVNGINKLKPGLTGNVQILLKKDLLITEKIKLEVDYLNNFSLINDTKIFFNTFIYLFKRK